MTDVLNMRRQAPELGLPDANRDMVSLEDYRGKNVVLAFYPGDWTPVCKSELQLLQEKLELIRGYNAEVVAVSCDTTASHASWVKHLGLAFPLLSDFWPHGEAARRFGIFRDDLGTSGRAIFFIDGQGALRDSWITEDLDIAPGLNVITKALKRINESEAGGRSERKKARVG